MVGKKQNSGRDWLKKGWENFHPGGMKTFCITGGSGLHMRVQLSKVNEYTIKIWDFIDYKLYLNQKKSLNKY